LPPPLPPNSAIGIGFTVSIRPGPSRGVLVPATLRRTCHFSGTARRVLCTKACRPRFPIAPSTLPTANRSDGSGRIAPRHGAHVRDFRKTEWLGQLLWVYGGTMDATAASSCRLGDPSRRIPGGQADLGIGPRNTHVHIHEVRRC
jgi:hypothetical protein